LTALRSKKKTRRACPTRPVRLVAPAAPASASDILGRLMGQWLSERLGQQFIIENRPGGGNNIGTEAVVRAPADGYTIALAFNFDRDKMLSPKGCLPADCLPC
jgi:tripartite-type tricarboxylate transporter receptor subunit TctC